MLSPSLSNDVAAYRAAIAATSRSHVEYDRALRLAHARPKSDLETMYLATLAAQAREARLFKRLMQAG